MKMTFFNKADLAKKAFIFLLSAGLLTSCQKSINSELPANQTENEAKALSNANDLQQNAATMAAKEGEQVSFSSDDFDRRSKTIVDIAISNPNFSTLVAAVVKTGLAGALSDLSKDYTVFAPTNDAFTKLPAPFNTAANINAIANAGDITFLKNVLLYHVLGQEVFSYDINNGSSSAVTLKPRSSSTTNDNTIYISKNFGLIRVNGQSDVILPNVNASNGVIHAINKVLLPPAKTIAAIAIGDPNFSILVAALVKTNLAGVFTGDGNFTVFAPINSAFAQLPAPFNSASNINAITNTSQINALANILKYHVFGSREFTWNLGILKKTSTLATAPNNKLTTILGYNTGWVKGNSNTGYIQLNPADILATNGVIHVINKVLLP